MKRTVNSNKLVGSHFKTFQYRHVTYNVFTITLTSVVYDCISVGCHTFLKKQLQNYMGQWTKVNVQYLNECLTRLWPMFISWSQNSHFMSKSLRRDHNNNSDGGCHRRPGVDSLIHLFMSRSSRLHCEEAGCSPVWSWIYLSPLWGGSTLHVWCGEIWSALLLSQPLVCVPLSVSNSWTSDLVSWSLLGNPTVSNWRGEGSFFLRFGKCCLYSPVHQGI